MSVATRAATGPSISKGGSGLPSRVVIYGCEGGGKTSIAAFAPSPVFSMTPRETGLLTLIDNGLCPPTDHFDECVTWNDLLAQVRFLTENEHKNRTYVVDAATGAEAMCFAHVIREKYHGDQQKFADFDKGAAVALNEWAKFLMMLDELRAKRRMSIMILAHAKVATLKNPEGEDYDRYTARMHKLTWGATFEWADVVGFLNFETFVKKDRGGSKAKGYGGEDRIIYTQRTAAFDAKNRLGLPSEIRLPRDHEKGFSTLRDTMAAARAARQQQQQVTQQTPEQQQTQQPKQED